MEIINKENGNIYLGVNNVLQPGISLDDVLKFNFKYEHYAMRNGYESIRLQNINLDDYYFFALVAFKNKLVTGMSIGFTKHPIHNGWQDWDRKEELDNEFIYEKWLTNQLGDLRNFNWGQVSLEYDPKNVAWSIGIRYQ